ncbi:MAG: biotin synthase BioB [Candidatus Aegiribacteria sp.]|nr:biotin synthase BioB [Candidatus Aegiribacteria sp.]
MDLLQAAEPDNHNMQAVTPSRALEILLTPESRIQSLLSLSYGMRAARGLSDEISFCCIINAKSGDCTENCSFCAQSSVSSAPHKSYLMMDAHIILSARKKAGEHCAGHFSIVTSGGSPAEKELAYICEIISRGEDEKPFWCASLGILSLRQLRLLKDAGLRRYHHNLETERTYFSEICTTHTWQDRANTVRMAKVAGLEICSGGIIGLGESLHQRVSMAFQLRDLEVDSIALNFLIPLDGTEISPRKEHISPVDMLKTVIMFGMVCPDSELRLCAGRGMLGEYEKEMFRAGITGIMSGDLLTTSGSRFQDDLELLEAAGRGPAL